MTDKKKAGRANVRCQTKHGYVLAEGKCDRLVLQKIAAENVVITHVDADHVLATNTDRLLADNSLVLGNGRSGSMVRTKDGVVLFLSVDGPGANQVELSECVPPARAEFVGALFLKPELREHVLGCRAEDFTYNVARFGRSRAVVFYWWDIAASLRAPLWALVKRALGFAALADAYRRVWGGW
jgi:hypothetical protein